MPPPKVVAIVLNWNRVEDTLRCVASLRQSDYRSLEVLVVDNGSAHDSFVELQRALPETPFIRSEINLGFAGGNNLGLREALAREADYALVVNNDTVVDPAMVGQLVAAGEARPEVGLLGPVIYYLDQPNEVWFAGYRFSHGIYLLRRGLHLAGPLQPVEEVDFVSGCGVLIRRSMLEQGLAFPERYFMYYEDLDLCFRAKAMGFGVACVTGARMWHAVSASTGGADSPLKQYYQVKSSLIFYREHSHGWKLWLNITLRLAHALYTLTLAVLSGRLKIAAIPLFAKGLWEGWRTTDAGRETLATVVATVPVHACPVCEDRDSVAIFEGEDRLFGLPGRFLVARCQNCGSCYLTQRPADLSAYYPPDRYSAFRGATARAPGRSWGLSQRRRLLQTLKPAPAVLLDVGCGSGDFLAVMQAVPGWRVAGLEPNPSAADYARQFRGLDVREGELPRPDLVDGQFDVVTLWHVLEHVPDPAASLADVHRLLRPDGVLVVAVPVADSWEARVFGPSWAGYDVPRHLVTFTRSSLERLLHCSGFQPEERSGVIQGLASLQLSLVWWLQRHGLPGSHLRSILASLLLPLVYAWMRLVAGHRVGVAVYIARPVSNG